MFPSEYYEIFKSTYFEEHLWTGASILRMKLILNVINEQIHVSITVKKIEYHICFSWNQQMYHNFRSNRQEVFY